jgi:hypothetical protein
MPFPAGSEPRRSTRLGPSQPVRPHPPASGSARSSLLRNCAYQPVAGRDRHHLPAQLTSFVGREQELAMLGKLLGEARLVTLTGVGATRKTRLTVEFADGVWLADLAGLSDPNLVGAAPGARTQNPRIKKRTAGAPRPFYLRGCHTRTHGEHTLHRDTVCTRLTSRPTVSQDRPGGSVTVSDGDRPGRTRAKSSCSGRIGARPRSSRWLRSSTLWVHEPGGRDRWLRPRADGGQSRSVEVVPEDVGS